jgi:osmotically-inducible protein OsmY
MPEVGTVINELVADPDVIRAVADALAQDERTAPYVIRVEARHGVVMLRGQVASEAIQDASTAIASGVPLVAAVRNQLTIGGDPRPAVALARPTAAADVPDPAAVSGARP